MLCGGKSSRMGEDKSKLQISFVYKQVTFAKYMYKKLSYIFDDVYLSYKDDKSYDFSHKAIIDTSPIHSPLIAFKSIFDNLRAMGHKKVFIIAVDFVNINKNVIKKLYYSHKNGATISKTKHHKNYLCGVYDIDNLSILDDMVKNDNHKVGMFFEKIKDSKTRYFKNDKKFLNLNYKQDYENYLKEKRK